MDNYVLKKYYETFGEFPFLLETQDYNNDIYELLMLRAISDNKPLTREEIEKWFRNDYDVVDNSKKFDNFKKGQ